jgi:hypothetical protein
MRKITWKNSNEQTCILTIQDSSNGITNMVPSGEPFMTSTQQATDIFTPIRTSSGYVRVELDHVDDVDDLVGSAPLQRAVELTVDGVVRWRGFLACESFTQAWDVMPSLELPVMSPMEAARGLTPSAELSALGYINFAQFIVNMNAVLGNPFEKFFFPVVSNPSTTLRYQFDMKNYAEATDNNTKHEVADYYTIMEDICKLFGWQCIEYETSLVFMAADVKALEAGTNNNFRGYTAARLAELAAGTNDEPTEKPAFTPTIPVIFGAEHRLNYIAGKKSVEVSGDLNERNEEIWGMDVFQQCEFKGNNFHSEMAVGQPQRYTVKKMGCIDGGNIEVFNNVFSGGASLPDTDGNNIKYERAYLGATNAYGASITYEQFAEYENTLPYKTIVGGSLDFFQRLILKAYSQVAIINARIATNFFYDKTQNQQYNAFRVSADVKYAENATDAFESSWGGQKYLEMSFVIKDGSTEYYYDRTDGWNTEGGIVQIYVSDGKIDEASYNSIPAPDNIKGEFVLYIWSSTDGIGDGFIALENLSIQLYTKEGRVKGKQSPRVELDELRENENVDKVQLSNGFTEEWSQSCGLTMAREAVPDSFGVVLAADKSLPERNDLPSGQYPEEAMAERASTYFAKSRKKIEVIVESVGKMLSPFVPYTFLTDGKQYLCLEQQLNWKTNEVTAGFFEPTYEDE